MRASATSGGSELAEPGLSVANLESGLSFGVEILARLARIVLSASATSFGGALAELGLLFDCLDLLGSLLATLEVPLADPSKKSIASSRGGALGAGCKLLLLCPSALAAAIWLMSLVRPLLGPLKDFIRCKVCRFMATPFFMIRLAFGLLTMLFLTERQRSRPGTSSAGISSFMSFCF